ncbi:hypothetical protein THRCLA_06801 [Thraustotheca clavata]|uniref:RAP domain-containing protein n=1 Tax=Thraustotheca clavata TaxID=74557 RepID=A0A1V9ZJ91_9STRA|nr:hypothetical protein THRCLA_06801 [Thraustotheca clavata]
MLQGRLNALSKKQNLSTLLVKKLSVDRTNKLVPFRAFAQFTRSNSPRDHSKRPQRDNSGINNQLTKAQSLQQLMAVHEQNRHSFNIVNTTTFFNRLGKLYSPKTELKELDDMAIHDLLAHTAKIIQRFNICGLSTIAHGLAKIQRTEDAGFFNAVVERVLAPNSLENTPSICISNLVWSAEKLGCRNRAFYTKIAKHMRDVLKNGEQIDEYSSLALSNISMSFAKANMSDKHCNVYDTIERMILKKDLISFEPQHISNILWAFSSARRLKSPIYSIIETFVETTTLEQYNPIHLASMVSSYAKQADDQPTKYIQFFNTLEKHLAQANLEPFTADILVHLLRGITKANQRETPGTLLLLNEIDRRGIMKFRNQNLVILAWSLAHAKMPYPANELYIKLEKIIVSRGLASFRPTELSALALNFHKAGATLESSPYFKLLLVHLQKSGVKKLDNEGLSNVLWTFLQNYNVELESLFTLVLDEVSSRDANNFTPSAIANFTIGFASSNKELPPNLKEHISSQMEMLVSKSKVSDLVQLLWGLTVLDQTSLVPKHVLPELWTKVSRSTLTDAEYFNLYRFGIEIDDVLVPEVVTEKSKWYIENEANDDLMKSLQNEVITTLGELSLNGSKNVQLDGGYTIGVLFLPSNEKPVAIQLNNMSVNSVLESRYLKKHGYDVAQLDPATWSASIDKKSTLKNHLPKYLQ